MTAIATISRRTFVDSCTYGIDLDNDALNRTADRLGVGRQRLARHDRDGDGTLRGRELQRAFRLVDSLDRDGSGQTFKQAGAAGALHEAMLGARRPGPYHGMAIAKVAISIAAGRGGEYARDAAPTSENGALSGNVRPGRTRLTWLAGRYKCNQFVGDALWRAGVRMPSYKLPGGGEHYVNAEALPHQRAYFDRLARVADLRVGDVIVIDFPGRGQDGAHTEIVTHRDTSTVRATGAHADGAYETEVSPLLGESWSSALSRARRDGEAGCWRLGAHTIYLLRPRRRR